MCVFRSVWSCSVQVFGPPEATNLWIGDERSVTSFHKGVTTLMM